MSGAKMIRSKVHYRLAYETERDRVDVYFEGKFIRRLSPVPIDKIEKLARQFVLHSKPQFEQFREALSDLT